jgi:retinol dehydrogenase-13
MISGARVILACKDMKKCEETKNEIINKTFNKKVECSKCDLASLESIKEFVNKINESNIIF